jgi:hypothetical protein
LRKNRFSHQIHSPVDSLFEHGNSASSISTNPTINNIMKNFILTLAIVGAAFFGMTTPVKAGNYHNHCGKRYSYWVTVITYKDYYSNNSYRDWKRPIS